jgi:hypothetical protein
MMTNAFVYVKKDKMKYVSFLGDELYCSITFEAPVTVKDQSINKMSVEKTLRTRITVRSLTKKSHPPNESSIYFS